MWRLVGHPRGSNHFITYPYHAEARQVAIGLARRLEPQ
jgi:hypothetical protein